jgi:hypothetical protein
MDSIGTYGDRDIRTIVHEDKGSGIFKSGDDLANESE